MVGKYTATEMVAEFAVFPLERVRILSIRNEKVQNTHVNFNTSWEVETEIKQTESISMWQYISTCYHYAIIPEIVFGSHTIVVLIQRKLILYDYIHFSSNWILDQECMKLKIVTISPQSSWDQYKFIHYCGYWWLGALAPDHQYPQCWPTCDNTPVISSHKWVRLSEPDCCLKCDTAHLIEYWCLISLTTLCTHATFHDHQTASVSAFGTKSCFTKSILSLPFEKISEICPSCFT